MSKYSSLQRIISSHVREELDNGGDGWEPFRFFTFIIIAIIVIGAILHFIFN